MFKKIKHQFVLIYILLLNFISAQDPFFLDIYKYKKADSQFNIHFIIGYNFDQNQDFLNSLISTNRTAYELQIYSDNKLVRTRNKEFKITELINAKNLFDI
ncbi:MAG: hypothetical protein KDD94_09440, partial [Calditrichaeota bacterium]|nr:hypothetical protein [Calditrichota bacterium]